MSEEYKGYIDECMPSALMRNYLKGVELKLWRQAELVSYSPVSVEKKLAELKKLQKSVQHKTDPQVVLLENSIRNIEAALEHLAGEGVFSVEVMGYDPEAKRNNGYFDRICADFAGVKRFIRDDLKASEVEPDELYYYEVSKWEKDDSGEYENVCTYIIAREEIIYCQTRPNDEILMPDYIYDAAHLNLPVPFESGDILEIDGFPFGPKFHILILDIGDNSDCCCVQGLALNDDGLWSVGAVKHGMVGPRYSPKISYLYSAKKDDAVAGPEAILKKVSDFVNHDAARGELLYNKLWYKDFTDDELTAILEEA